MPKYKLLFITVIVISNYAESAKILGICHVPNKSHFKIASSLLYGLAAKGHKVTIASPYPVEENIPNVKNIFIDGIIDIAKATSKTWTSIHDSGVISFFAKYRQFSYALANAALNSREIKNLLKSEEQFDVVIFDIFQNQAFFGFGEHFNASTIVISTGTSAFVNSLAGNVAPYSFVPNKFTYYSDKMTFVEILFNTLYNLYITIQEEFLIYPEQKQLYDRHFNSGVQFNDAVKRASLFIINSHVLLETPRPYLPNMISVAGLHIKTKQLPEDLQEYLDNATNGVILFSFGSVLNPKNLPDNKKTEILKAFAKLPQKILWKFDDEIILNNIKTKEWLPQNDILAHPNVKLFITHGGLLSCIESLHHGVPILGVPFFGDQFGNVQRFVNLGFGKILQFQDLTETTFYNSILELVRNKSYSENIKEGSKVFKDRVIHPLDEATFWVEHVIKHKGAQHLQSRSVHLSWAQYLLLDIISCIVLIVCVIIIVFTLFKKKTC